MNHLNLTKNYWKQTLSTEDLAIDATCGNGHDTLFLAQICSVIATDIQKQAIQNTKDLLTAHRLNAEIHQMCHSNIDQLSLPKPPRLIVYNLGYLPRGDKNFTTKVDSTLESLNKSLDILSENGALSITCYPGHAEGELEEKTILEWAKKLPKYRWRVCFHQWINSEKAPSVLWIESVAAHQKHKSCPPQHSF